MSNKNIKKYKKKYLRRLLHEKQYDKMLKKLNYLGEEGLCNFVLYICAIKNTQAVRAVLCDKEYSFSHGIEDMIKEWMRNSFFAMHLIIVYSEGLLSDHIYNTLLGVDCDGEGFFYKFTFSQVVRPIMQTMSALNLHNITYVIVENYMTTHTLTEKTIECIELLMSISIERNYTNLYCTINHIPFEKLGWQEKKFIEFLEREKKNFTAESFEMFVEKYKQEVNKKISSWTRHYNLDRMLHYKKLGYLNWFES